jgi:hypothetical protein
VYFAKMPHKTHHLRADSLAIMLSLANVGAHAEVIDGNTLPRRVPGDCCRSQTSLRAPR